MDRLLRHPWPGNVRELMNAVERGVVLSRGDYLDASELSLLLPERGTGATGAATRLPADTGLTATPPGETVRPAGEGATPAAEWPAARSTAGASLEAVERETILRTLGETGGNKSEAARRLGITRRTLHQKLRRYGMM
jgi:two-component system response regulator HydG